MHKNYQQDESGKIKINIRNFKQHCLIEVKMNSLIKIAVALAFTAIASGNLPWILTQVRKAQVELIMESKASKWPKAMILRSR